jgi:drug/metabolite transporter (DMT)-like permease
MISNKRTIALISILAVVLVWGSAFSVSKVGVQELPPLFLALMRNAVATLVLLPFYLAVRKKAARLDPGPVPLGKIILLGLTGITFFYAFFNISLTYTGAAMGSLIQGIMPLVIVIPAAVFLKEKITGKVIAGILISIAGVILVGFIGQQDQRGSITGNILMACSVCCWAAFTLISRSMNNFHPIPLTFFVTLAGTIMLIPCALMEGWNQPLPVISSNGWMAIAYLGILSSAICYILYNQSLKILTAAQASNFLNLDPVIGSAIALIFLKEHFSSLQFAGGALVLVGVWLSSGTSEEKQHS